ncbi:MAG: hypothetical protein BGO49_18235 [Planctomycetales bacterium 71-10]|nr:MAG: hypothetical protein BGO49_18235 [Planctomycetales bacterium 71-10]
MLFILDGHQGETTDEIEVGVGDSGTSLLFAHDFFSGWGSWQPHSFFQRSRSYSAWVMILSM